MSLEIVSLEVVLVSTDHMSLGVATPFTSALWQALHFSTFPHSTLQNVTRKWYYQLVVALVSTKQMSLGVATSFASCYGSAPLPFSTFQPLIWPLLILILLYKMSL